MDTGLADACDTCLVLGLGYEGQSNHSANRHHAGDPKLDQPRSNPMPLEPSLKLSLPDDAYTSTLAKLDKSKESADASLARQSSIQSTISSFSGIKREKDAGCEEVEAERVSRASDEEEDGCARKKLRLTKEQSALLEDKFNAHTTLNPKQKQALATQLNLRPRQVEVWFQNRRARTKLKQTEVDCEVLKKCCETLTDENRRLQKELQELRAIKFAAPLYMHLPTAAITMCPSCKRIGSVDNGSKSSPLVAAQKRQFLGPIPHSAAC